MGRTVTITVDVDEDWLHDFDDWCTANGKKTRSQGIRDSMTDAMKKGRR